MACVVVALYGARGTSHDSSPCFIPRPSSPSPHPPSLPSANRSLCRSSLPPAYFFFATQPLFAFIIKVRCILFCFVPLQSLPNPEHNDHFHLQKHDVSLQSHSATSPTAKCVSYLYSRVHVHPSRSPNLGLCSVPPGDRCPRPAGSSAMSTGPVSCVRRSARPLLPVRP